VGPFSREAPPPVSREVVEASEVRARVVLGVLGVVVVGSLPWVVEEGSAEEMGSLSLMIVYSLLSPAEEADCCSSSRARRTLAARCRSGLAGEVERDIVFFAGLVGSDIVSLVSLYPQARSFAVVASCLLWL
jgi:hypothetical protein